MIGNEHILNNLKSILGYIFDYYDVNQTKVDAKVQAEESWPIGTDVYVVCGILRSQIYVQRLYVVDGATETMVQIEMEKMIERFKKDISKRSGSMVQNHTI
ncbi:hypothetical protein [Sphingobacterium mizutaii]|uniref:hypothetical protein n=1 Tax=Sphingobacterium mizutaii TaxID=1010 RepID=UPI001629E19D|nr:hypothetical protein [Sphingobacterium mizutaii]